MTGELISRQSNRLIFSIVIPGFIGLFPWLLLLLKNFKQELDGFDNTLLLFVFLIFSMAFGLVFHLIGVKIELEIDEIIKKCCDPDFDNVWQNYLSLEIKNIDNVRKKYMSFLIDRYQYQLNMIPSLVIALTGLFFFLDQMNWQAYHVVFFELVGLGLIVFLIRECYYVATLLHKNRKSIIIEASEAKQTGCGRKH